MRKSTKITLDDAKGILAAMRTLFNDGVPHTRTQIVRKVQERGFKTFSHDCLNFLIEKNFFTLASKDAKKQYFEVYERSPKEHITDLFWMHVSTEISNPGLYIPPTLIVEAYAKARKVQNARNTKSKHKKHQSPIIVVEKAKKTIGQIIDETLKSLDENGHNNVSITFSVR